MEEELSVPILTALCHRTELALADGGLDIGPSVHFVRRGCGQRLQLGVWYQDVERIAELHHLCESSSAKPKTTSHEIRYILGNAENERLAKTETVKKNDEIPQSKVQVLGEIPHDG